MGRDRDLFQLVPDDFEVDPHSRHGILVWSQQKLVLI
jgi:hypothetical protein